MIASYTVYSNNFLQYIYIYKKNTPNYLLAYLQHEMRTKNVLGQSKHPFHRSIYKVSYRSHPSRIWVCFHSYLCVRSLLPEDHPASSYQARSPFLVCSASIWRKRVGAAVLDNLHTVCSLVELFYVWCEAEYYALTL